MRNCVWAIVALVGLSLVIGCSGGDVTATTPPHRSQPTETLAPVATLDRANAEPVPACPPASGPGTVSPAVSIYSITFLVNDIEQVVRDGDNLQAMAGDQVQVREVTICTGSYSGSGGEACVDLVPLDQGGEEIVSGNGGTHLVWVTPGFTTISGPDHVWTLGENWQGISAVLNHWPPERSTRDVECGGGLCERDDWMLVEFR